MRRAPIRIRRTAQHALLRLNGPPHAIAAHRRQIPSSSRISRRINGLRRRPLTPLLPTVLRRRNHARMIIRARRAPIVRYRELRDPHFPQLDQLVEFVDEELEQAAASLAAVDGGRDGAEDVVEDAADAVGVGG